VVLYIHKVNIVKLIVVKRFREDVVEIENFRALFGENIQLGSCYNIKSTFANIRPPSMSNFVLFKQKLVNNKNIGSRKATLVYSLLEKRNTNTKLYLWE
jgi:hypothetical protein